MKPTPPLVAAMVAALIATAGLGYGAYRSGWFAGLTGHSNAPHGDAAHGHDVYTCPMHPQVVSDKPGSCPICHMDLVKKAQPSAGPTQGTDAGGKPVYTCPMHPQVVQDHPGSCPICHMDLVRKQPPAAATQDAGTQDADTLGGVTLSPRQRVLANVATATIGERSLARAIAATGRVTADEGRLQQVSAWIGGRIDRLYVGSTGQAIRKGQPLVALYSPELVAAQQEHLVALKGLRELGSAPYPELAAGARDLVAASRQRLRFMGVTAGQLATLTRSGRPTLSFPIVAPASGVVLKRLVQAGQYVETGAPLFDIADFSRVWVEAELFESDLGQVRAGQPAEVRVAGYPDKVFRGRVGLILPTLQAETRTTRVRIELANPQGLLKPDMYATVRIAAPVGAGNQLAVPASAVIATGRRHVVYVEVAPNRFVPRAVMVGAKAGDHYPVFKGLAKGDKVAVSGGFLLDATAQLQGITP